MCASMIKTNKQIQKTPIKQTNRPLPATPPPKKKNTNKKPTKQKPQNQKNLSLVLILY